MLATVCTVSSTDLSALLLSAPAHVNLTWAGALLFGACGVYVRSGALAAEALAVSGRGHTANRWRVTTRTVTHFEPPAPLLEYPLGYI